MLKKMKNSDFGIFIRWIYIGRTDTYVTYSLHSMMRYVNMWAMPVGSGSSTRFQYKF